MLSSSDRAAIERELRGFGVIELFAISRVLDALGLELGARSSMRLVAPLIIFGLSMFFLQSAHAELLIQVNKSTQRMTVTRDGEELYDWPVSTGGRGYETPGGDFKPFRMEIDHYSDEYDQAPMPHSIFFTRTGIAIHGTYEQRNLGKAVSHGCVRLSLKNAATLWGLVKSEKMANTEVVLRGGLQNRTPIAGRVKPQPYEDDNMDGLEPAPQSARRVDDGRTLSPNPFFGFMDR